MNKGKKCFTDIFYDIAQRNIKKEIFRVDIGLYISTRLLANQRSEFTNAIS
jgi:hypothetical protein